MKSYRNILIIRTDRIGDVVLTTSILQPLRQCFPKSRISMLVSPVTFDLVNGHKDIDEVFVDDRADLHKGLAGFLRLIKEIKRKDFDVAIIFHTKKRTNALCYFAGIPRRIGYRNNKFGFLLTDSLTDQRHLGEKHETQYCLEVVQYLAGKKVLLGENKIMINSQAEQWAENLFKENKIDATRKIIAIHLGASDPAKCWPQENFIEVITQLQKKYPAVILLIGAQNTSNASSMVTQAVAGDIHNLSGQTTVKQLVSILKRCDLLISNDSGPVHIADALGVAVISLFTRNQPGINPERWRPLGNKSRVISVSATSHLSFQKANSPDVKYLQVIKPQQVLEEVDALFKLC